MVGVLAACLWSGAALLLRYRLETVRTALLEYVAARTGAHIEAEHFSVSLLRGVQAEGLRLIYEKDDKPLVRVEAPLALLALNLSDLASGRVSVDHLELDRARMQFYPASWSAAVPSEPGVPAMRALPAGLPGIGAFRVVGSGCRLEIGDGDTVRALEPVDFSLARVPGVADLTGYLEVTLGERPSERARLDLRFVSALDFDLRLSATDISADRVARLLPSSWRVFEGGSLRPRIRVERSGAREVAVTLDAAFHDTALPRHAPSLGRFGGEVAAIADYDPDKRVLSIVAAQARSPHLAGSVEGAVTLASPSPVLDLHANLTRLPVALLIERFMATSAASLGVATVALDEPTVAEVSITGPVSAPSAAARLRVAGGQVALQPVPARPVEGTLQLGKVDLAWDSTNRTPAGTVSLLDGSLTYGPSKVTLEGINGRVALDGALLTAGPVNARLTGNPILATASYDLSQRRGKATVDGTVSRLEDSLLAHAIANTTLAGAATVRGEVSFAPGEVAIQADLDATHTRIGYQWWFDKPSGVGATAKATVKIDPAKSLAIEADLNIAQSDVHSSISMRRAGNRWALVRSDHTAGRLDIASVGRCLAIPYAVTGGSATNARYTWGRGDGADAWEATLACSFDDLSLLASGAQTPVALHNAVVAGTVTGGPNTGRLTVTTERAVLPPFSERWFAAMRDPNAKESASETTRVWEYKLAAADVAAPPWKGTDFSGEAYAGPAESGLRRYSAKVDGGTIEGTYRNLRPDNAYETTVRFVSVPARYLLAHLKYPEVLTGVATGSLDYSMDRDDPGTLHGSGTFEVANGEFSADYVMSQFQDRLKSDLSALPPSLKFSSLKADVAFQRDHVETRNINLVAEGVTVTGQGSYVRDGDMDYTLALTLSPDLAERIPAIRDSINVQGHRLSQQNIQLTFRVTGPTFRPRSQLAGAPPMSVTLVSGALAVTSELIDFPRKILVDLLKIGGGLVGAGS